MNLKTHRNQHQLEFLLVKMKKSDLCCIRKYRGEWVHYTVGPPFGHIMYWEQPPLSDRA